MKSRCFLWVSLVSKLCVVHCALCLWSAASSIAIWNCSVRFRFISFYLIFFVYVLFAILLCTHLSYIRALCMILILILYPFYDTSHFQSKHKIRVCLWVCIYTITRTPALGHEKSFWSLVWICIASLASPSFWYHLNMRTNLNLLVLVYFILFCFCWFQNAFFFYIHFKLLFFARSFSFHVHSAIIHLCRSFCASFRSCC